MRPGTKGLFSRFNEWSFIRVVLIGCQRNTHLSYHSFVILHSFCNSLYVSCRYIYKALIG